MKQRHPYQDGLFVDDQGRRWQRTNDYLEPAEVRSLLREGVHGLVEWCGGGRPARPEAIQPGELERDIVPTLLERTKAAKKMSKSKVPTVLVAELWCEGSDRLIIFVEGAPAPRVV